ncbi:MAG TPA: hypothetical protein ENJ23_00410, partial [Bacteroidetes bacterium]|nr:hypothetical protein [Bacteroidota bacterium]
MKSRVFLSRGNVRLAVEAQKRKSAAGGSDEIRVPAEWQSLAQSVRRRPGAVLLLGASDSGKSTLARYLISQFVPKGRVGLIDADIGQSTVGPPACISYADCPADFSGDPGRLRPAALSFARSLSPGADPLGFFLACERIVRFARERRPQFLLVDTTGFIDGVLAVELKLTKVEWL